MAKLEAKGFITEPLALLISYHKNREQSVRVNNTLSDFKNIYSGFLQKSIIRTTLSINDVFYFITTVSVSNFADDDTLSAFAKTTSE